MIAVRPSPLGARDPTTRDGGSSQSKRATFRARVGRGRIGTDSQVARIVSSVKAASARSDPTLTVLVTLIENRGLVLTREQLLERVWGYTFLGDSRTIDVHVRQLRRKLGDASPIVTVWGVGYKVSPARDGGSAS